MTVKVITAKEARKLLNKLGFEVNDDARTFYAKNEENDGVWKFESKAKRDEFVRKVNKNERD
jgi:myo-inositol-hexaphosphate 3-phosphohydrolase